MGKTAIDARRHIREIEKLFEISARITKASFQELLRIYKNEKYLKQSMERLIARGFIKNEKTHFSITPGGIAYFKKLAIKEKRNIVWDGKWRIISFDVPGGYSADRNRLRGLLQGFDFYQLQKSVWVCPNSISKDFWKLIVELNLHRFCKAMVVEIIDGDESIKKHFHIKQ